MISLDAPGNSPPDLLTVDALTVDFQGEHHTVHAVRGITYQLSAGEVLAIVGESGSGKTVSSLALLNLLPASAKIGGTVRLAGQDLSKLSAEGRRRLRSTEIAMVFQDPMTALNPVRTIGSQLVEVVRAHRSVSRSQARKLAVNALDQAQIPQAAARMSAYIHEMSGGMRQRVMIAMAIVNEPRVLIADEPTTALDVTVQAQILDMLSNVREATDTAILLITHDLGVVAEFADRVMVMYAGRIVEHAPVRDLFSNPQMPYTVGLLASTPSSEQPAGRLRPIPGTPPMLLADPTGCPFAPRCPIAMTACETTEPLLEPTVLDQTLSEKSVPDIRPAHRTACLRRRDVAALSAPALMFDAAP